MKIQGRSADELDQGVTDVESETWPESRGKGYQKKELPFSQKQMDISPK